MSSVVHGPCLHALPREASAVAGSTVWQLAAGAGLLLLLAAAIEDVGPARIVAAGLSGLLVLGVSLLRLAATWA